MPYYKTCQLCGANLDPGERCDCKESAPSVAADEAHDPDLGPLYNKASIPERPGSCKYEGSGNHEPG